jgi:hypothetical protein
MPTVFAHQWLGQPGFHWLRHKTPKDYKKIVAPFDLESILAWNDVPLSTANA